MVFLRGGRAMVVLGMFCAERVKMGSLTFVGEAAVQVNQHGCASMQRTARGCTGRERS